MSESLRITISQLNYVVGDLSGNASKIIAAAASAAKQGSDLIVFSELSLTGYPPEDLLLRPSLQLRVEAELENIARASADIAIAVGFPWSSEEGLLNCAAVYANGVCLGRYAKQRLPNYQVFDEQRYFTAGDQPCVVTVKGRKLGLTVCEDIWHPGPAEQAVTAGAEMILNLNASPYHMGKQQQRVERIQQHVAELNVPLLYVNQVGGQDELVFDGRSFAVAASGRLVSQLPAYQEAAQSLNWGAELTTEQEVMATESGLASLYNALVLGVRDYVNKNGFKGVVLGLSGGIDSALTLAIAADAIGAERVKAMMMPFTFTSGMSKADAAEQAERMGVAYESVSIEPMYNAFMVSLAPQFAGLARDTTEENLQARCRGVLLMAVSNKTGYMVLTTGNKSEMAVGYATLYGDMVGGYSALKDVYKTTVFKLAEYRNSLGYVIPQRVIDRPPSAELAPDQKDEDSLPPYDILDAILERYIEQDMSAHRIIADGFDEADVLRVLRLVDVNEYKRRQAPIGVRITQRGFGRDRRYPVTNGWRAGV